MLTCRCDACGYEVSYLNIRVAQPNVQFKTIEPCAGHLHDLCEKCFAVAAAAANAAAENARRASESITAEAILSSLTPRTAAA